MPGLFDADTAVHHVGDGVYEAAMDRRWWVVRGPNGGYVAAVVLRALTQAAADPARSPRSLTVHYTAPPAEGPVRIETAIARVGRSLTTVSARMVQEGRLLALALGAFSTPRDAWSFDETTMPVAAGPDECDAFPAPPGVLPPIHQRYDYRWAIGDPPFSGSPTARVGGWVRLAEDPGRPVDGPFLAAVTDGWLPAVFPRLDPATGPLAVPTVDLTVHFRATLPAAGDWVLAVFRSRLAAEGFLEEDGEVWSRDGVLLAQSRQLALVR